MRCRELPGCGVEFASPISVAVHWHQATYYLIDFEGSNETGVIEYGIVTVSGGAIVDTATRLCGGRGPVRSDDVSIHGITSEAIRHLPPFDVEWQRFVGMRSKGVLGAHHAQIENGLLRAVWLHPPASPDWLREGRQQADWGPWLDTRRLYESIYPGLPSYALAPLIGQFHLGDTLEQVASRHCPDDRCRFHCALYDALASALLLLRLGELEAFGGMSVAWLIQHSAPSSKERQRRQQRELW